MAQLGSPYLSADFFLPGRWVIGLLLRTLN